LASLCGFLWLLSNQEIAGVPDAQRKSPLSMGEQAATNKKLL
jgi:hypothetical protein